MVPLADAVKDIVGIVAVLSGAYFFVGFITNIAQAQISNLTGDPMSRARAIQQGGTMIFFLCIAVLAKPFSSQLQMGFASASNYTDFDGVKIFWEYIVKLLTNTIIGTTITALFVGAVYNGLGLQLSRLVGLPVGMSRSISNIITIAIGIALTVVALTIANSIVTTIFSNAQYIENPAFYENL